MQNQRSAEEDEAVNFYSPGHGHKKRRKPDNTCSAKAANIVVVRSVTIVVVVLKKYC